jgi:predicted RNA-binding Zn ribbon-like protein
VDLYDWLLFFHVLTAFALVAGVVAYGVVVLGSAGDAARRALAVVALDAARMLGRPEERARMRVCASDTCSARFYDRSPAGRRRWCSMRTCGNEAKARRHRARARSGA